MCYSKRVLSRTGAVLCAVVAAALLATLPAPRTARAEDGRLRVMTWNVWGVPVVSEMREARMRRIVPALREHAPDLVALQEVWHEADGRRLARELAQAGWPHVRHFAGAGVRSGLLIASKYPIESVDFVPFSIGDMPHTPWHIDWVGTKGVALAEIRTPEGTVTFANTHMQAAYATDAYLAVRVAQAMEVADILRRRGGEAATVLAGDLNSPPAGLPFRLLASRAGLLPVADNLDIDAVLFRDGDGYDLSSESARHVLTEAVDLGGGTWMPLSDHPAVLADLKIERCGDDCRGSGVLASARRIGPLTRDALAALREGTEGSRTLMAWTRGIGVVVAAFVLVLALRLRRQPGRPRWARRAFAIAVVGAAAWLLYVGFSYGPRQIDALQHAQAQLVEGTAPGVESP